MTKECGSGLKVVSKPGWRELHSAACKLYEAGFSVIRLVPNLKKPADSWAVYQTRRATTSEINTWWSPRTASNPYGIGVVAGIISNNLVLDFDPVKGSSIDDLIAEAKKKLGQTFPETCRVLTSGGGYHDYYRINTSVRTTDLFQGVHGKIQLRGEGTQTVVPPTIAHSDRIGAAGQYTYIRPLSARLNLEDTWLKNLLNQSEQKNNLPPTTSSERPAPSEQEIQDILHLHKFRLSDTVKNILDGRDSPADRSAQCYRLACEVVRAGITDPYTIASIVMAAPYHKDKFGDRPKNSAWGEWNHAQRLAAKTLTELAATSTVAERPLNVFTQSSNRSDAAPNTSAPNTNGQQAPFECVPLNSVQKEECTFLLDPYFPRGELTLLDGDPGIGKSWVWMALAAGMTDSKVCPLPQIPYGDYTIKNLKRKPKIMLLTTEDSLSKTVRPRLEDLGADLDCIDVFAPTGTSISVTAEHLEQVLPIIQQRTPDMVVIDPTTLFESSLRDFDNANAVSVRKILSRLINASRELNFALIIVRHFRKASGSALHRGAGSIDYAAAARSILTIGKDKTAGELIIAHTKSNLAPKGHAIAYALRPGAHPVFEWLGPRDINPDTLTDDNVAKKDEEDSNKKSKIQQAAEFVQEVLTEERCESKVLFKMARDAGISEETLRKALESLHAKPSREGSGRNKTLKHYWELPPQGRR